MQIHELTENQGNLAAGDYFATDSGTVTTKIDYAKLARAIIEQYNLSMLAGSSQSVQSAVGALATRLTSAEGDIDGLSDRFKSYSGTDLNDLTASGIYYCNAITTNRPAGASYWLVIVSARAATTVTQIAVQGTGSSRIYTRHMANASGGWQPWNTFSDDTAQLVTDTFSGTVASTDAGGASSFTTSVAKTGYTPIGIIDIQKSGASSGYICTTAFRVDANSNAYVQLYNPKTAEIANTTVTITVLYRKS